MKSSFWDRFKGSVDVGASYTSASELLQLDLDGDMRYRRPKFEAKATANAVLTQQPDVDDTRRASLTLGYTRLFSNRQRVFTQATFEQTCGRPSRRKRGPCARSVSRRSPPGCTRRRGG